MRDCGSILEKEINRKRVIRKDLSEFIGTSPQNLSKILRKDNIDVATLEKFCQYLDLDPADFFDFRPEYVRPGHNVGDIDQQVILGSAAVNISANEIELMERLISEKDARIANLEKTLDVLLGRLSKNNSDFNDNSTDVSRT